MNDLKRFRKSRGMTQSAFAAAIGVTLSLYEKVESGRAGVSASFMRKFKSVFPETTIDDIFFNQNSKNIAVVPGKNEKER